MDHFREFKKCLAYHFSELLNRPFARPQWVYISLSHNCTYNCRMCGVVKILKGYELPAEMVKKSLDEIYRWGWGSTVLFTGGEPFLRKDIFELIEHSVKRDLKTEIVSNGSLMTQGLARKIMRSGLNNVAISLDGDKESTHDNIREKGSFKKAIGAIKTLVQEKMKIGHGPQISVWTTIMKENVTELFDIAPLVRGLGAECLVYHPVIVAQEDMQNTSPDAPFWINRDNLNVLKEQLDRIIDYKKRHGMVSFLHDPYLWLRYFEGGLVKKDWKCNPFVFINIGPDGEVRSCGSSFGNVKEMGLDKCLDTEDAFSARESMKTCQKSCLQTCWAHPESDRLVDIATSFLSNLKKDKKGNKKETIKNAFDVLSEYERILKTYV